MKNIVKKHILSIIFLSFTLCLVIFSNSNLIAAKNGLKLWAQNVVPALFPFFVATELLSYTNVAEKLSCICAKFMTPLFKVPGNAAYAFILGIISGYPVGAKIVTNFRLSNLCSKDEGERMLAFTNNSGPLFIIGTVGITLFKSSMIGILLLITHILSSITVGISLGFFKHRSSNNSAITKPVNSIKIYNISNLGEILGNSILSASKTIISIGGFVVLFSVIISILSTSHIMDILLIFCKPICSLLNINPNFIKSILVGLIELTNGVSLASSIPSKNLAINIIICAFLLGFGGLSILLQVLSITSKSDLSIKKYIIGKFLQGIIAAFYTYIFIINFGIFNYNL